MLYEHATTKWNICLRLRFHARRMWVYECDKNMEAHVVHWGPFMCPNANVNANVNANSASGSLHALTDTNANVNMMQ